MAGPLPGASRFFLDAADPRQPLIGHLCKAFEGVLDPARARAMVDALADARNDPAAIADVLRRHLGELDEPLETLVQRLLRIEGTANQIGWLPLRSMIKVTDGVVQGFKGPTELQRAFRRWISERTADGIDPADLTPERFVEEMRLDLAIRKEGGISVGLDLPTAHERYLDWVHRKFKDADPPVARGELNNTNFAAHPPEDYIKFVSPQRRPALELEALFGPRAARVADSAISSAPNSGTDWARIFGRIAPDPEPDWKARIVGFLTSQTTLRQTVEAAFRTRYPDVPAGEALDERIFIWMQDVLNHHIFNSAEGLDDVLPTMVYDRFLSDHVGDSMLRLLLGPKLMANGIHSGEFVQRLLDAYEAFATVALKLNIPWDTIKFREVGGMFELVQKAMSQAGHVKGYVFELEVVFVVIRNADGSTKVVVQLMLGGKAGPDILLVKGGKVFVIQLKSLAKLSDLYGFNGEAARQTGSDLLRFLDEVDQGMTATDWPDVPVPGHGNKTLDNVWLFYFDARRAPPSEISKANAKTHFDRMNELFRQKNVDISAANGRAMRDEILGTAGQRLEKDTNTRIRQVLEEIIAEADEPISVAELAILRLFFSPKMPAITPALKAKYLARARQVAGFANPLEIGHELRDSNHLYSAAYPAHEP